MKNDYTKLNDEELELFLRNMRRKIEDLEDEREIMLEKSQGQHTSSKYVQSNVKRLNEETESINSGIKEITIEIERRKRQENGQSL
jgi:uncharacterized protein YdeI (YjbR/CyaY-like superfamily)